MFVSGPLGDEKKCHVGGQENFIWSFSWFLSLQRNLVILDNTHNNCITLRTRNHNQNQKDIYCQNKKKNSTTLSKEFQRSRRTKERKKNQKNNAAWVTTKRFSPGRWTGNRLKNVYTSDRKRISSNTNCIISKCSNSQTFSKRSESQVKVQRS